MDDRVHTLVVLQMQQILRPRCEVAHNSVTVICVSVRNSNVRGRDSKYDERSSARDI